MPSVTYMNQSAPFWDFVASLEQQGTDHPWFAQWSQSNNNNNAESSEEGHGGHGGHHGHHDNAPPPWAWGFPGFGGGRGFPHRGPPPPPGPPPPFEEHVGEKEKDKKDDDNDNGEEPSGSGSDTEGCRRGRERHGRCGGRRGRHAWGQPFYRQFCSGRGGPHSHGHGHGRRGGWEPWGGRGVFGGDLFNPLAFATGLFNPETTNKKDNEDFTPEADIFDTDASFVVHISLPGAKKEDLGVNWNAEKSELSIAGVIHRPGDEEFLKTLAMDGRKVGPFERKVRLGTRANPAVVDADGISAKLEDGVLRVEVPKLGDGGFVEVRKVDIE